MSKEDFDVAVIGAGAFGAWTAYSLGKAGQRVVLLDAYGPGNSRASSGGETRIIRMGYGHDELYTEWSIVSLERWKELARIVNRHLFVETGVLWMAQADDPYTLATVETLTAAGVSFSQLSRTELTRRYPQISFGPSSWAVFEPESGTLLARRAVEWVVRAAESLGVEFRPAAAVPPATVTGELKELSTLSGKIRAKQFVFACGPWLAKLFPDCLSDVIFPTRQDVCFFGVPPGDSSFGSPAMPAWIDFQTGFYGVPDIEQRGLKMALHQHGPPIDPDVADRQVSAECVASIRAELHVRFPALKGAPLVETRVCQYENTPSGNFLVDRHPRIENAWFVGGGSGHGFKHGPAMGEYVAGLLTGTKNSIPQFQLGDELRSDSRRIL